jgi:hypothetical protein
MDDPANTVALLKADAVVGVKGVFDGDRMTGIGITCALCHSTVDDKLQPGIGSRLDGWANRDLNVGAIVAAAPDLSAFAKLLQVDQATVRKVLTSWGPGKYDAELSFDGKALRPDGKPAATLIPSAFGLLGVNNHTWTGAWGTVTYWNAYVAVTQMHGQGTFYDPRLLDKQKFPVGARANEGNVRPAEDKVTAKLPALQYYQLSLPKPKPPADAFDATAREAGRSALQRQGALRYLPRAADLHRAGLQPAHRRRDRHRRLPGAPLARRSLPHRAAARAMGHEEAPQGRLLPRRALRHARRRGEPLRPALPQPALGTGESRPDRVPQVDLS